MTQWVKIEPVRANGANRVHLAIIDGETLCGDPIEPSWVWDEPPPDQALLRRYCDEQAERIADPNHAEAILRKLLAEDPQAVTPPWGKKNPQPASLKFCYNAHEPASVDLTPEEFTYLTNLLGDETP